MVRALEIVAIAGIALLPVWVATAIAILRRMGHFKEIPPHELPTVSVIWIGLASVFPWLVVVGIVATGLGYGP